MIARTWHGIVPTDKATRYHEYLLRTGVTDYRATPGNCGVFVLQRPEGDITHFRIVSFWESLDSIRAFAGDDIDRARYYAEDSEYLTELEPTVTHEEVVTAHWPGAPR